MKIPIYPALLLLMTSGFTHATTKHNLIKTETSHVSLEVIAKGLKVPRGCEFLPDGNALVYLVHAIGEEKANGLAISLGG